MTTKPSNDAIAQAFWEVLETRRTWLSHATALQLADATVIQAREIDAAAPTPPKVEPVAYCDPSDPHNSTAFAWPGTMRIPHIHTMPLYTAQPAPTPSDDVIRDAERWRAMRKLFIGTVFDADGNGGVAEFQCCIPQDEYRSVPDKIADAAIREQQQRGEGQA